jgi:hypothetical protein
MWPGLAELESNVSKMSVCGGLWARRVKGAKGSLSFTMILVLHTWHLLWRPQKPDWVERLLSPFPLQTSEGGAKMFLLLTLILFLFEPHGDY